MEGLDGRNSSGPVALQSPAGLTVASAGSLICGFLTQSPAPIIFTVIKLSPSHCTELMGDLFPTEGAEVIAMAGGLPGMTLSLPWGKRNFSLRELTSLGSWRGCSVPGVLVFLAPWLLLQKELSNPAPPTGKPGLVWPGTCLRTLRSLPDHYLFFFFFFRFPRQDFSV